MDARSSNGFFSPGRFDRFSIHLSGVLCWAFSVGFLVCGGAIHSQQEQRLSLDQVEPSYPFLRQDRLAYRNFAYQKFGHYPNHSYPYVDQPQAFYNSMGDYLVTGYPIYWWTEDRMPGQEYGSDIFKDYHPWTIVFDNMLMARDGYGSWGYSAVVGDALIARFSPLTLSMANFNGLRVDVSTPHFDLTALGSRIERPKSYHETPPSYSFENSHFADDNTMLVGSRVQTQIGNLRFGLNGTNLHVYRSTQPGNSLKGVVRSRLPLFDWLVVRFTDDSPADGTGGALGAGCSASRKWRAAVGPEAEGGQAPGWGPYYSRAPCPGPQASSVQSYTIPFAVTTRTSLATTGDVRRFRSLPIISTGWTTRPVWM